MTRRSQMKKYSQPTKTVTVGIILLFLGACLIPASAQDAEKPLPSSRGNWLYVGGDGPGNYTMIQDAIDNASDGDAIFVYNGIYYERLQIIKSLTLMGEEKQNTIIDGCHFGTGITIESNNTEVYRFTLRNCDDNTIWERWGIFIVRYIDGNFSFLSNITIADCIITQGHGGIIFYYGKDSRVQNCSIFNNSYTSLVLRNASENIIIDNSSFSFNGHAASNNSFYNGGVVIDPNIEPCTNVTITSCTITNNIGEGLELIGASNAVVKYSIIQNNSYYGIVLARDENVTIEYNKIAGNKATGIDAVDSYFEPLMYNILIRNNTIIKNGQSDGFQKAGIYAQCCKNSLSIIQNNISSNYGYGIYLQKSNNNIISRNNFENNPCHAYYKNTWRNKWVNNYWDTWIGIGPKIIYGHIDKLGIIPWVNFDWHPAQEPYDIPGMS
jgi:parallel beta-helix repeat protein